jgi:DNA-binding transcriptional LysR family regulator
MNVNVMKVFCDLVDTGSFSRAAEANGISQSAVSQQVASLERDLGTRLVTRGSGFAVPTDAGLAFYRGAKDVLLRYDQMLAEIRSAEEAVRAVLHVGTIYSVGFYLLDPYVRKFLKAHPDVNLDIEYTRWNRITAAVLSGEMDLGVVAFPEKHRSIEVIPFATEELVMVCSPNDELAGREQIDPSDLRSRRMVAFEANVPTRRHIDRVLRGFRVPVEIKMEFDNIETLKRAIEVDAGFSILPAEDVQREVAAGHLHCVPFRNPGKWKRAIGIIRRSGRAQSRAERVFLQVLRSPT